MSAAKKIIESAPCRVDFAGGTVDLWPLYLYLGGLELVQMGVEIRARAELSWEPAARGHSIHISSADMKSEREYPSLRALQDSLARTPTENPLRWVNRLAHFYLSSAKSAGRWTVRTSSGAPPGSGLGGSSVLGISLAHAFERMLLSSKQRREAWDLQQTVRDLEAIEIEHPAGDQDYVPALFGGLLVFKMGPHHREIERLPFERAEEVGGRCALLYTGKPHHSGLNNWQVFTAFHEGHQRVRSALTSIARLSGNFATALRSGASEAWPSLLNDEWALRQKLSPAVGAPVLEAAWAWGKRCGAVARKACGAGGGGCLLLMFPNDEVRLWATERPLPRPEWRWLTTNPAKTGCFSSRSRSS